MFNKTGLQPVSRPVEQILGLFPKKLKKGSFSKSFKIGQVLKKVQQMVQTKIYLMIVTL